MGTWKWRWKFYQSSSGHSFGLFSVVWENFEPKSTSTSNHHFERCQISWSQKYHQVCYKVLFEYLSNFEKIMWFIQGPTERGRFGELVCRTFLIFKGNRSSDSIRGNGNFKRNPWNSVIYALFSVISQWNNYKILIYLQLKWI